MSAASLFHRGAVAINYMVKGNGPIPVLLIAPGGYSSRIEFWSAMDWNPLTDLDESKFRLIALDQRNAGQSSAPIDAADGWDTYCGDMVALLDFLGVGKCMLMGSCIGPSYAFKLLELDPERFPAAVMMQPIGRAIHTTEKEGWTGHNDALTRSWVEPFVTNMVNLKVAGEEAVRNMTECMVTTVPSGPWLHTDTLLNRFDFVFSVNRRFVQSLQTPLLVLMGQDGYHPSEISREIARLAPNADIIEEWKAPDVQDTITQRVTGFLTKNGAGISAPSNL